MLLRKKPIYLKRTAAQRADYLARQSDDELRVLSLDLQTLGMPCMLVREELQRRGLDTLDPDDHDLPHEAFGQDETIRRLPNVVEFAWKWLMFKAIKSVLPLFILVIFWASVFPENELIGLWIIGSLLVCLTIPIIFCWTNLCYTPLRYTLIRPFNSLAYSEPLKRFVTRNIGHRSQGVGLACKEFKTHWFIVFYDRFQRVALFIYWVAAIVLYLTGAVLAPWIKSSPRLCRAVKRPSEFHRVSKHFKYSLWVNIRHFFTGGQCFNIRAHDSAWRYTIQCLIHHSDFIIVDLSSVKPSSEWEIEYLLRSGRIVDCIPVCQEGFEQAASGYKDLFIWPILIYNKRGKVLNSELPVTALIREITEPDPSTLPAPTPGDEMHKPASDDKLSTLVGPQKRP